jgi:hypothetical protein
MAEALCVRTTPALYCEGLLLVAHGIDSPAPGDIHLSDWRENIMPILQNRLMDEAALIRFARDHGVHVSGAVRGDPGTFRRMGWLDADDSAEEDRPLFHPFRLLQLVRIIHACRLPMSPSSSIDREAFPTFLFGVLEHLPSLEHISSYASRARAVADLAVLLEPIYWPRITSRTSWSGQIEHDRHRQLVSDHQARALELLRTLDVEAWRGEHERLRWTAADIDGNGDLYMLLRLSPWSKRERVRDHIGGGMWLRHMAEVIRRGFEEAVGVVWAEEDQDYGHWFPGAREDVYGSIRPLDAPVASKPYVAFQFGLHTGSVVRWYVEGETEYFATMVLVPGAATGGVELVNLRGAIASGRGNAAMRLGDLLAQDRAQRRFSIISFDTDVGENLRTIRRHIEQDHVVGYVAGHTPDFEFGNFTLAELVEVAVRVDESYGVPGTALRAHDWVGVTNSRAFEHRYLRVSERRPRGLKGQEWGEALAKYAIEKPYWNGTQDRRPFLETVEIALRALRVQYDHHRAEYQIDPNTFRLIPRPTNE